MVIGFTYQHAGHDDDRQRWLGGTHRLDDVTPLNRLQAEINQRHGELLGGENIERRLPRGTRDYRVCRSTEQELDDVANRGLVVDDENRCHDTCWLIKPAVEIPIGGRGGYRFA